MACEPSCGTRRRDILRLATVPPTRGQQQIGGSRTHKFRMQFPQCKNQRTPKNRRIATIRLQDLKYCPGNCMRNCEAIATSAAGVEGAGGSGGHGRASRSTTPSRRLACGDLAGGPPPTGTWTIGSAAVTREALHPLGSEIGRAHV